MTLTLNGARPKANSTEYHEISVNFVNYVFFIRNMRLKLGNN